VHLELLVEDFSTREALNLLLPKLLPSGCEYDIKEFRGKQDLLKNLPDRLKGYATWMPEDWHIVTLVDRDGEDCHALKSQLEAIALRANLTTKTTRRQGQPFQVLNRIMIEELEAWFFGDVEALRAAYPGVSASLAQHASYRDPDAISGGTWEALERVLKRAGHFKGGLDKVQAAREIAQYMEPSRNRSASFQIFRQGILSLFPPLRKS
jgi:hypothetical protein